MSVQEEAVLTVRDLETRFETPVGVVRAVRGVSFDVMPGEAVALVGESGSGKTVTFLSLLGLVPPPGRVTGGSVRLEGRELLDLDPRAWADVRGRRIAMVFQDPMTSLNPVLTVGRQLTEGLQRHLGLGAAAARLRAVELLARVGIPDPGARVDRHPHELSGGQRQRVLIAMAVACEPRVLIADEPTTALDVTVQRQIVELVQGLREELGMAVLWITHDLALASTLVDRVLVMYAGRVVEEAPTDALFRTPGHPYTRGLLGSMPSLWSAPGAPLASIPGSPPSMMAPDVGCAFAPRCPWHASLCDAMPPLLREIGPGRRVACVRDEAVQAAVETP